MLPTDIDPRTAAIAARSILSCATAVNFEIDGVAGVEHNEFLTLIDYSGHACFVCPVDGSIAAAAQEGREATVRLVNGLKSSMSDLRAVTDHFAGYELSNWDELIITGVLRIVGRETCPCCEEVRVRVVVDADGISIHQPLGSVEITPDNFSSPDHALNPGYLQRTTEHVRDAHHDELCAAAATLTAASPSDILGAQLLDLTAWGATLAWVDLCGGHQQTIWFPRVAQTPNELATLLRNSLHPGIC